MTEQKLFIDIDSESIELRNNAALELMKLPEQQEQAIPLIIKAIKKNPDNCGTLVYALSSMDIENHLSLLLNIALNQKQNRTQPNDYSYEARLEAAHSVLENIDKFPEHDKAEALAIMKRKQGESFRKEEECIYECLFESFGLEVEC